MIVKIDLRQQIDKCTYCLLFVYLLLQPHGRKVDGRGTGSRGRMKFRKSYA